MKEGKGFLTLTFTRTLTLCNLCEWMRIHTREVAIGYLWLHSIE